MPGTTEVLPELGTLLRAYRGAHRPIVHAVRLYLPDATNADLSRRTLLAGGAALVHPGTPGSQLAPELDCIELDAEVLLRDRLQQVGPAEHVMFKPRWNAFYATALAEHLRDRGVDTVVVAGCNYPNCPRGTLFGASERDYRAVLVTDAVSGWTDQATSELAGLGVHTATTGQVLDQLQTLIEHARDTTA